VSKRLQGLGEMPWYGGYLLIRKVKRGLRGSAAVKNRKQGLTALLCCVCEGVIGLFDSLFVRRGRTSPSIKSSLTFKYLPVNYFESEDVDAGDFPFVVYELCFSPVP